ncbi:MAG: tetratricopeptide repeat protein, partial [Bacteroidota bacterium]
MLVPFSRSSFIKKAVLLALLSLEILWNFQAKGLFGQNSFEAGIQQKERIAYSQALETFRKQRLSPDYQRSTFALELENEMVEVFLALAEFDSAKVHLGYPIGWEKVDVSKNKKTFCQRYYLSAQAALQRKDYPEGSSLLALTDSLAQLYAPKLLPKVQLRYVRLDIATGKFGSARKRLEKLEKGLESYDPVLKADFHFEKGFYNQLYKRFDISVGELGKALDLYQENLHPLHPKIALSHTFLSYTYRGKYELKKSIHSIREALRIQEQVLGFKHPHLATTYYYYATTLNMIGDYPSAARYNEEAIRVYRQAMGEKGYSLANYYSSLGYAKRGMNQPEEAENAYRKALEYYLGPPVFRQIDKSYYNYSVTLFYNEKFAEGLKYLNKAYEVRKAAHGEDSPLLLNIYEEYGEAYMQADKWKEAKRYFEKCLKIEEKNPQKLPTRMAAFKSSIGKIERNLEHPRTALKYQEEALAELGFNLSASSRDELDIIGTGRPGLVAGIFHEIALLLEELGNLDGELELKQRALEIYKQSDHFIDQRRLSFFSEEAKLNLAGKTREIFEKGISLAYDLYRESGDKKYLETALYFSGKSKSLLLLLGLKESFALQSSGIPETLTQREWELELELANLKTERYDVSQKDSVNTEQLVEIEQKLFHAERARDSLINTLEKDFPDYHALKYELALPSVAELQNRIPSEMKVLDYFWGEEAMFIFSLDKSSLEGYKVELRDSVLLNKINEFRTRVFTPFMGEHDADFIRERNEFAALSYGLRKDLLPEALIDDLQGFARLKIIPDGAL